MEKQKEKIKVVYKEEELEKRLNQKKSEIKKFLRNGKRGLRERQRTV